MQSTDDFDLIDKYLRNEMTPEEASAFEKTLAHNEELRKEVEIRYDIMVGIRASEQNHILEELEKIDNQNVIINKAKNSTEITKNSVVDAGKNKNNIFNTHKINFGIVLIFLIIVVILIWFFS